MAVPFLQIADLHLGAALPNLPGDVASELRASVRTVTESAFAEVRKGDLQLVLMPGDLYEHDGIDPMSQLRFVYELAASIAPVPVAIAPGNHDPYGPGTAYERVPRPDNVLLFTSSDVEMQQTSVCPIAGRAFQVGEISRAPSWSHIAPTGGASVLLLHGSLIDAGGYRDDIEHKRAVAPLTLRAIEESGFTYAAVGHYHKHCVFGQRDGACRASYSGCPQGQGWDELGPKGYLIGELTDAGAKLEFIKAAPHVWRRLKVQLPPDHVADRTERLRQQLAKGVGDFELMDAVSIEVTGRWPAAEETALSTQLGTLLGHYWHQRRLDLSNVEMISGLVSAVDSRVIEQFMQLCDSGAELAGAEKEAWELARYLGQRLLSGLDLPQEITP